MPRTTSAAGRAALMAREGCRLAAYRDGVGVPTIGVGHTGRASPPAVEMGMTITSAEADAYLAADLAPMEAAVSGAVKVALTQNQFDACVSLAFNIGAGGFTGSTVVHKLNANDPAAAADAFLMWEKPQELKARRIAERAQFLEPDAKVVGIGAAAPVGRPASTATGYLPPIGPHSAKPTPASPSLWARFRTWWTSDAG